MNSEDNRVWDSLVREYERVTNIVESLDRAFFTKSNIYFVGIFACVGMIFNKTEIVAYFAIIFVFLLLYYTYNTIKYTIRICELRGQAITLEKRMNSMLKEAVYSENILSIEATPIWYNKFFYGVVLQTVFIIPVICFCGYILFKSINVLELSKGVIIVIVISMSVGGLTLLAMILICCFVSKYWSSRTERFWKEWSQYNRKGCENSNRKK